MGLPAQKLERHETGRAEKLPQAVRDWHAHFEASYFQFMTSLMEEKPDLEKARAALMKFRVMRNIFMNRLMKAANMPGLITSLDDEAKWLATAIEARRRLFDAFPGRADALCGITDVPVCYLPFIKVLEDPAADVLGQTFKLGDKSFMMVRNGSGRELDTTMHEYLHSAVRNLPAFFEEGFCRHALQSRGIEESDLKGLLDMGTEELSVNFAGIQYPALMVAMMSEAFGAKAVEDAFFGRDVSGLQKNSGVDFSFLNIPYVSNIPEAAAICAARIGRDLEGHLSGGLKAVLEKVQTLIAIPE